MSTTQIECGTATPFFSLPADPWSMMVTPTWTTNLWQECIAKGIEIRFHTDLFWTPKAVREHDVCIMDVAKSMYHGQQLLQINSCRIVLQVIYLSDISMVDGKRILLAYYGGKKHSDDGRYTRLQWPPVGPLLKKWWDLRMSFCKDGVARHCIYHHRLVNGMRMPRS